MSCQTARRSPCTLLTQDWVNQKWLIACSQIKPSYQPLKQPTHTFKLVWGKVSLKQKQDITFLVSLQSKFNHHRLFQLFVDEQRMTYCGIGEHNSVCALLAPLFLTDVVYAFRDLKAVVPHPGAISDLVTTVCMYGMYVCNV